jgi:hypothetical protein
MPPPAFPPRDAGAPPPYPYASPPGAPPVAYPGAYPGPYAYGPPPRLATFSTILSAMFDVWTKNFVNFFLVFLVVALVDGSIGVLINYAIYGTFAYGGGIIPGFTVDPGSIDYPRLLLLQILTAVSSVIINSIVVGGMTEYTIRRHRGEATSLEQALRRGFERFLSVLGASILLRLLVVGIIVIPLILIFLGILGLGVSGAAVGLLCGGGLLFVVGGIIVLYVLIATSLFAPAIMMENQNAVSGLSRSWQLTKGYRWSLFGAFLVTVILSAVIGLAIATPASLAQNVLVDVAASAIIAGLIGGWFVILAGVAYDLIVRTPTYGPPPYYGPVGVPPAVGPTSPPSPPATPPSGP